MTNEMKKNYDNHVILTNEALLDLKEKGYKYLQVQGYTLDHHLEYVEPHYLMLVPVKDFSDNRAKMGIYEDISSETVVNWANNSNEEGFEIFLAVIKPWAYWPLFITLKILSTIGDNKISNYPVLPAYLNP